MNFKPMTKIEKISKNITPFAGVFYAHEEYNRSGLCELIDNHLGNRNSTKGYSYPNLPNLLYKKPKFAQN